MSLSWGEACRYPATYKNFTHSFCFVQLVSFLWSFSFAFARGLPTCIYYGLLHAGIGSQQVNSLFQSHEQWGRRERVGETRKWKVCEKGGGAGKRKKEGRESLRRPSFSQFPPFLFSFLYLCSFVLSCEHVLWRNVVMWYASQSGHVIYLCSCGIGLEKNLRYSLVFEQNL